MRIFFRFLARPLPVGSTVGVQNFGRGRYPLAEIFGKNCFAVDFGTKCELWLHLAAPFRTVAYSSCNIYFTGPF